MEAFITPVSNSRTGFDARNRSQADDQILISDDLMWHLNLYVSVILCGAVSCFGTLCNMCNMMIFFKLEFKDSMSVCLFSLSLTDFLLCFVVLMGRVFPTWDMFFNKDGIDPMILLYAGPSWLDDSLFLCSGWILTLLSLERCVCVLFPFKVRQIFTRHRAAVAVVWIYVIMASTNIPIYMSHWLAWERQDFQKNDITNETMSRSSHRLIILFSDNRQEIDALVNLINSTVVPIPSLVLTTGSVLWMSYGLKKSSKFRESTSAKSTDSGNRREVSQITLKTRILVKVVLFLALLFIVFSIPRLIATFITAIFPAMNEGGRGRNANTFLWELSRLSSCLNGSVNICVYLKINSSYQEKFRELFSCRANRR